ncbi:SAM-dependent methyltransferase [Salinibacter sp. 10B]|uniref:class I SAM-dependent methyltransferase n=1 Tax=Salinibacter sp. 10B TaxID=1923971 RepID=UPI000CF57176|nr:class I SAM-dependent methyltransferase [Salinibacter sp. 10B]PQJ26825.1 SAM-dependent methyltransferase [Salinibacter sp. 10B]
MTSDSVRSPTASPGWMRWWNRTRYQLYAPIYDWVARPLEEGRKRAIEQVAPSSDDRILILGSGPGSDLEYLPREAEITAVDVVPEMVRRTTSKAEALDMNVDAQVGDVQALSFEDDSFDVVLLHLILSVVPDPKAAAAEAARVLAPNGRVSIYDKFVPSGTEPSLLRRALNPLARFLFSDLTRELDPLLSQAGLEVATPRKSSLGGLYTAAVARPIHAVDTGDRTASE